ncbi:MAG: hypothetical protein IKO41_15310 [Lachnospiraceae bacterium]|nr:hypothetical protein [Lachnospiraceae bacterium]
MLSDTRIVTPFRERMISDAASERSFGDDGACRLSRDSVSSTKREEFVHWSSVDSATPDG